MCLLVVVHDCIDPVSDSEDRTVSKLCAYCGLDEFICLQINSSCRLVQNEDLRFSE